MEFFSIGDRPGARHTPGNPYTANPDKFPKSRRLTEINSSIKPFGWLSIIKVGESVVEPLVNISEEDSIPATPREITPVHRKVVLKPNKNITLEGVVSEIGKVEVFLPDGKKIIVRLTPHRSADPGKVIEVNVCPDGKSNFSHASFKGYKK